MDKIYKETKKGKIKMNSKAKKELKKYINSTQERIDKCSLIRDEIYEASGIYKISNIDENDGVNKEIRKQRKILKNLNEIQELSDKLCIGEKFYITDDIYFNIDIHSQQDSYILYGRFYFDNKITQTELYEEYYSSYGKLNSMINDVLSSVLCMTMAEGYGIPTINFENDIQKYEIKTFEKILDILNEPDNWKVKLLKETASNIISKILNNIEEYEY